MARGQGHKKISRPRSKTDPLKAKDQGHRRKYSPSKKVFNIFFRRKRSSKIFFRRSQLEEIKKRSLQILGKVSGVFQRNFNGSKIVLSSSRRQGNFRELEASRPRPRTSKCVLEAKNILEDSTSECCSHILANLIPTPLRIGHFSFFRVSTQSQRIRSES